MTVEKADNYELEERAAIREFDAGMPRAEAEFRAGQEIAIRKAQENIQERRDQYHRQLDEKLKQQIPEIPEGNLSKIKALREKLEQIGNTMRAETDSARKDELFGQWKEIVNQIIELRKIKKGV